MHMVWMSAVTMETVTYDDLFQCYIIVLFQVKPFR